MSRGTTGLEEGSVTLVGRALDAVGQWEFDSGVVELPGGGSDGVFHGDGFNLHNLDLSVSGSVSAGHVRQELVYGTSPGKCTELLGNVVLSSAALVAQSNLEVLDGFRASIKDLEGEKIFATNTDRK